MLYKKQVALILFCAAACNNNKNPYANNLGIDPALAAQIDTAHYTLIEWKDSVIDFGTIHEGDSVLLKYKFYNVGKTPLFILQTRPACGCTVTDFTKDPIMPGKYGYVTGVFKSLYHSGNTYKTIQVITNTRNRSGHLLVFKGVVEPAKRSNQ